MKGEPKIRHAVIRNQETSEQMEANLAPSIVRKRNQFPDRIFHVNMWKLFCIAVSYIQYIKLQNSSLKGWEQEGCAVNSVFT